MDEGEEPRRLSLEVHLEANPIKGRVYPEHAAAVFPFSGWVGLVRAIDAAASGGSGERYELGLLP